MASAFDIMAGGAAAAPSGWAGLGDAIGRAMSGGNASREVYDQTMLRGHRTQKALMDAKKASMEYQALSDLTLDGVVPPGQEALGGFIVNALRGGVNPEQGTGALLDGQTMGMRTDALGAARGGDIDLMNNLLTVIEGKPRARTKIEGNTIIDPYAAMTDQTPQLSPYGAGYLGNQAERVAGQNAAQMATALRPRATGGRAGDDPEALAQKEYDRVLKEAAQGALSDAKLQDLDVSGLNVADVAHALRTTGEFRTRDGKVVATFSPEISPAQIMSGADFSNVRSGAATAPGGSKEAQPPPAPAPGLPAAAAPNFSTPSDAMSAAPVATPKGQPDRQDPGLPPMLDYINGGNVGDSSRPSGAMPPPAAAEAQAQGAGSLPPQALAALKEGVVTTFKNGQKWTLVGGAPQRVN